MVAGIRHFSHEPTRRRSGNCYPNGSASGESRARQRRSGPLSRQARSRRIERRSDGVAFVDVPVMLAGQLLRHAKFTLFSNPDSPALCNSRNSAARSAARVFRRMTMTMP